MKPVSKDTLKRIREEFPTQPWDDAELEQLVGPEFGVITGFRDLLGELEEIRKVDLGTTAIAGPVRKG